MPGITLDLKHKKNYDGPHHDPLIDFRLALLTCQKPSGVDLFLLSCLPGGDEGHDPVDSPQCLVVSRGSESKLHPVSADFCFINS